ncbi:hypothetical protein C0991_004580 [Blastosporella zonata]|nr:hypothetical protein C0991_004580 [Blastosporella zonata]
MLILDHWSAHQLLILHRDVRPGHLLIFEEGENGETFGRLIDYDHAKKAKKHRLIQRHNPSMELLALVQMGLQCSRETRELAVDDDVVSHALSWIEDHLSVIDYILGEVRGLVKPVTSTLSKAALGWDHGDDETDKGPDYSDHPDKKRKQSGTLRWMSSQVILKRSLFILPGESRRSPFVHEAIQDMESIFWVLVHTCITRKGPGLGQMRHEELDPNSASYNRKLRKTVFEYFYSSDKLEVGMSKEDLFRNPYSFKTKFLPHFHPTYNCLGDLAEKWLHILVLGYKYRGHEFYNIHSHIRRILQQALTTAKQEEESSGALQCRKEEIQCQRKVQRQHLLDTFKRWAPSSNASVTTSSGSSLGPSGPIQCSPSNSGKISDDNC